MPGHRTIAWSSLRKIQEFHAAGGAVIATGELPSKSAEFGHDADVVRGVASIFRPGGPGAGGPAGVGVLRSPGGGVAIRLETLNAATLGEALQAARAAYDVNFEPGRTLRYIHKRTRDGREVYFFANLDPGLSESVVTLRGRHTLETWDPHTGTVGAVAVQHVTRDGTEFTVVRLALAHLRSVLLLSAPAKDAGVIPLDGFR
jgi:hypothetical protein